MARPEHMASIGYQIMHLREGVRACLLSDVRQLITPFLTDAHNNEFTLFYGEMLLGMSAQAREEGAQPKTNNQLRAFIQGKEIPEPVLDLCMNLIRLMDRPEPLDL